MAFHDLIASIITLLALFIAISVAIYTEKTKVPPVPTLPWVRDQAVKLLRAHYETTAPIKIVDLGSGWGGVMALFAKHYNHAQIDGYELSPWPFYFSRLRFMNRKRLSVYRQDFFAADLSGYDVLICYTHPELMAAFQQKIDTLKAGALIISCAFPIPNHTPIATQICGKGIETEIYLYRV